MVSRLSLLFFLFVAPCVAEDQASTQKQLSEVKAQVEEGEKKLAAVRDERKGIETSKKAEDTALASLVKQEEALRKSVEESERKIADAEVEAAAAEKRLGAERVVLENLAKQLYRTQRRSQALEYLLEARSPSEFARRMKYLRVGADIEANEIERFKKLAEELKGKEDTLKSLRAEKSAQLAEVTQLRAAQEGKNREITRLLQEIDRKEKLQRQLLRKLEATANQLERVLAGVMGSVEEKKGEEKKGEKTSVASAGEGLGPVKGKLRFPVSGTLVQKFGKQRHEEFSDFVVVKGLEVSSPTGSEVRPISSGKVAVVQSLPGLGNVVILDHGARYYSLYGRLATVGCSAGDTVSVDSVLGTVGEPDYRGRNFYFELRFRGQAVDPASFFAKLPPKA